MIKNPSEKLNSPDYGDAHTVCPKRRVVLAILDGWGIGPEGGGGQDAIHLAVTPTWEYLTRTYPMVRLQASEEAVGLPHGQMGNSEVGHMTIGGGRSFPQDLERITASLADGSLEGNPVFVEALAQLKKGKKPLHLMGLASPGGVHSHIHHMMALVDICHAAGVDTLLHLFLDGRDTPPQSALGYVKDLTYRLPSSATIATMGGRYWGMDRDKRWDRVHKAYDAIALGKGPAFTDPITFIQAQYAGGVTDEFIPPHVHRGYGGIHPGDGLLCCNFRADRVRQLWAALLGLEEAVEGMGVRDGQNIQNLLTGPKLGMTSYGEILDQHLTPLFPPTKNDNSLGEVISSAGFRQLRVAETEKYAHVTFFFNGGREAPFFGEDRHLVPSPRVATYDLQPEMSALEVTSCVVDAIQKRDVDFIVVNFANTDMVGHTGNLSATIKAVETVDVCLHRLYEGCREAGYVLLVTADHGNAEQMLDQDTGSPHTAHTCNLVPFLIANAGAISLSKKTGTTGTEVDGTLADIAPSILCLMGLPQPSEMTGKSLVKDLT